MEKKIRVAVIGLKGLPAFGGAASVGEHIINELKNEYAFTVYSTKSHTDKKSGIFNGFKQIVFRSIPNKKLNTLYYYILAAVHVVFFAKYDLVHLHHRDAAFIMLVLKLKYKVILTCHGAFYVREKWKKFEWYFKLQERYFLKLADIINCVSLKDQRAFKKNLNMDVYFIQNGVNLFEEEKIFTSNEEGYLFFGAGRIIKSKGCHILLKALRRINFLGKLVVAGDLDQVSEYKKEIKFLSNGLDIEFCGLIKDKSRLLSLIRNASLFIFPSSVESMSMMLLEGCSVRTPVICSNIPENRDIFNDKEVLFFETNSDYDLSRKILWALSNSEKMKEKASRAYQRLANNYLWSDISEKYRILYKKIRLA